MFDEEKWVTNPDDFIKSGAQADTIVAGNCVSITKERDRDGKKIVVLRLEPAEIIASQDPTRVGPRDFYEVRYYFNDKWGTTFYETMGVFRKKGIPWEDDGKGGFSGPVGKYLVLERTTIKLKITRALRDEESGEFVVDEAGKTMREPMTGTSFLPVEVAAEKAVEVSDEEYARLATLAITKKTAAAFKRAVLLDKETAVSADEIDELLDILVKKGLVEVTDGKITAPVQ